MRGAMLVVGVGLLVAGQLVSGEWIDGDVQGEAAQAPWDTVGRSTMWTAVILACLVVVVVVLTSILGKVEEYNEPAKRHERLQHRHATLGLQPSHQVHDDDDDDDDEGRNEEGQGEGEGERKDGEAGKKGLQLTPRGSASGGSPQNNSEAEANNSHVDDLVMQRGNALDKFLN